MKCQRRRGRSVDMSTPTRPTIWCPPLPSHSKTPTLRRTALTTTALRMSGLRTSVPEDVGPQDYGREDTNESPDPCWSSAAGDR